MPEYTIRDTYIGMRVTLTEGVSNVWPTFAILKVADFTA